MEQRKRSWHVWIGFLVCVAGVLSYLLIFVRYPVTRDVPWVTFLIFAAGLAFVAAGLRQVFGRSREYKGRIAGSILGALSVAVVGLFCFGVFYASKQLPKSAGAPKVGDKAPEFVLTDTNHRQVSLASLLATPIGGNQKPPKGVFLVFYRGYW
jgi:4-amino-4-deoxy-L-arabinose transferase-like glycosyltransferase